MTLVDLDTHAPLGSLLPEYHEGLRPGVHGGINRFTQGTALPRVPDEVIEQIIGRDSLALLGLS